MRFPFAVLLIVLITGATAFAQENGTNVTNEIPDENSEVNETNQMNETIADPFLGSREPPSSAVSNETNSSEVQNSRISALVAATKTGLVSALGGDSALVLLSGGLFLMVFLIPLSILSSVFWKNSLVDSGGSVIESGMPKFELGYNTGTSLNPRHEDDIVEMIKYIENADVKIISSTTSKKIIQVKNCRSCENVKTSSKPASSKPICDFEKGFFKGTFERLMKDTEVVESKCRAMGDSACEFEVKIKR